MGVKSKRTFKFQTDQVTTSSYFKKVDMYGVDIGRVYWHGTNNPDRDIHKNWIWDGNRTWNNITASKNQGMGSIWLIYSSLGYSVGDGVNEYDKALFFPICQSMGYANSLSGAKRPYGSEYPAFIDFDSIGFLSTFLAYKQYSSKYNTLFSTGYKEHLIKSSAQILAKYITRQDTIYLNPIDLEFYNTKDNSRYTGTVPDENLFRPHNSDDTWFTKQYVLRTWKDFKFYGSNLMLPKFIENAAKKDKYLKSLVANNEELISVQEISYATLKESDMDTLNRLVLHKTLGDYYDWNDNYTFTIDGNTYGIDILNKTFLQNNNPIEYIKKYNTDGSLSYLISFKSYKDVLKETFTDNDKNIQQSVISALKNNTALPSSQITDLKLQKWGNVFYLDTDKNGYKNLWYGKYAITFDWYHLIRYDTESDNTDGGGTSLVPVFGTEKTTYYLSFNEARETVQFMHDRCSYEKYHFWELEGQRTPKPIPITMKEAIAQWLYNTLTGNSSENHQVSFAGPIYHYSWVSWNVDTDGGMSYAGWDPTHGSSIATNISIAQRYNYTNEFVYEHTDGTVDLVEDENKVVLRTYSCLEFLLEIFGCYTNTNGLNKTNANYIDGVKTYFHEMTYTEGETWDVVNIYPIFTIDGVISQSKGYPHCLALTYKKKILSANSTEADYEIDNNGQKYQVEIIGQTFNPPKEYEKEVIGADGETLTYTKEYVSSSSEPRDELVEKEVTELVKFSLPRRNLNVYSKVSNYIEDLENGTINGYVIKYRDKTDGKIKVRVHEETSMSFLRNTCDLTYKIKKCLPCVPLWTQMITLDAMNAGIIEMFNPLSWFAGKKKKKGVRKNNFLTYPVKDGGGNKIENLKGFYYFYDKKVNLYYKNAFSFYLKEWEQVINGKYEDAAYGVKMKNKLPKRFTDSDNVMYSQSLFEKPNGDTITDYNSYQSKGTTFGYHTAIRFTFAIYFNKHFRRTKLICKMGYKYLDYFYKELKGSYGIWLQQILYPSDRIQFTEKRKTLRFMKLKYDIKQEGDKASYYCVFDNVNGQFIFYNKGKQEKIVLDINTYLPNWRTVYFKDINTYTYNYDVDNIDVKDRYGYYTITKNDIEPMKYQDVFITSVPPKTKYTKSGSSYIYAFNSIYYKTNTNITYNTSQGFKTRSVNPWTRTNTNDYACFYTPHSSDMYSYKFNEELYQKTIDSFEKRNVYDYLIDRLTLKTTIELSDIYKKIFGKTITVLPSTATNMFNYSDIFNRMYLSIVDEELFKSSDTEQYSKVLSFDKIPLNPSGGIDAAAFSLTQSYHLFNNFNDEQLDKTEYDTATIKSNNIACKSIAYEIIDKELPRTKYVSPSQWTNYFVNYNKDGLLAYCFTDYEIYQIGFINFLVTSDTNRQELSVLFENIMSISAAIVTDLDMRKGSVSFNSTWLPMPYDVYKRLPIYCKNFVSSMFLLCEMYNVTVVPSVNEGCGKAAKAYAYTQIVSAIISFILSIIAMALSFGGSTPLTGAALAWTIVSIVGTTILLISSIIQLIAMVLPQGQASGLMEAAKILGYIGSILSIVSAYGSIGSLNTMQIANLAIQSITFAVTISTKIIEMRYEKKQLNKNKEYNVVVDKYNQSVSELNQFIQDYEFEAELLNTYQPLNFERIENDLYGDKYDSFLETYIDGSLSLLYEDLDNYYDNRIS